VNRIAALVIAAAAAGGAAAGSVLAMSHASGRSLAGAGAFARSVLVEEVDGDWATERSAALVTVRMREPGVRAAVTLRVHVVRVDGRWAWILARPFVRAIEHGRCPDRKPLPSGPPV
jgi:hypothetical protein